MSFHRKAFLIWLTTMTLFVAVASAVGTHFDPAKDVRGGEMEQLIEAALAHAKALRTQAAEEEAERWERLATAAQAELTLRRITSP
jgi:hypothetical protein